VFVIGVFGVLLGAATWVGLLAAVIDGKWWALFIALPLFAVSYILYCVGDN